MTVCFITVLLIFLEAFGWTFGMYLLIDAYVLFSSGEPGNFIYTALTKGSFDPELEQKTEAGMKREMEIERSAEGESQNKMESKVRLARLVSLPVTSLDEDLCMSFWYRFTGEHTGALRIWQKREGGGEGVRESGELQEAEKDGQRNRSKTENVALIWIVEWQETKGWKEGRVLLPHADKPYKVTVLSLNLNKPLY